MMKTRRISVAVLLASFLSTSVPITARADDDAITAQARARFKEGVDAYDKGQYENARLAFLQAYTLKKHPSVLLNLAQSTAKAGRSLEAARYFQQFLRESGTSVKQQRDAEGGLAEVRQRLGRIEITAPAGAEITMDDTDHLGTAPFNDAIDVDPGLHTLSSSSGEIVRVTAVAGQKTPAEFGASKTEPAKPSPPPEPVSVEPAPPSQDTHSKPGLFSPPETMVPVYIGAAVGVAGLVSTIWMAVAKGQAQSANESVERQIGATGAKSCDSSDLVRKLCVQHVENNKDIDTDATVANISAVVMAAGFLTAGGWYLFGPKRQQQEPAPSTSAKPTFRVEPYGGWGQGGLNVVGTF